MRKIILGILVGVSLFASVESEVDAERFSWKNGVLTDSFAKMQWQDNKDAQTIKKNWQGAKEYCANLTLGGKNDWRLPNMYELEYAYKIKNKFNNLTSSYYWSSSPLVSGSSYAWLVGFKRGRSSYDGTKTNKYYVRCVRAGQYDTLTLLEKKVNNYRKLQINKKYQPMYEKAKNINSIKSYAKFIKKYSKAPQIKDAQQNIQKLNLSNYKNEYTKAKNINTIESYSKFIKIYSNAPQVNDAQQNIYRLAYNKVKNINTIKSYFKFIQEYSKAPQVKKAIESLYILLEEQNNISGYEWFIKTYPKAPQVKEAIETIHKLAYNKAKEINTISAYNTFIYSYPFASQVRDANDRAYKLESNKYKKLKKDDEKKARLLAVRIKKLTVSMKRKNNKDGYIIVKDRMIKLLTEQYEETDASLRYYESKEFIDFTNTFENVMSSISSKLTNIENYSSQIVEVSKQGFEDANANREMSRYKDEQHHQWEKRMRLRDKGNM